MSIAAAATLPTKHVGLNVLYLSGAMTGLPEFNYPAFHAAAATLRSAGYTVYNPAENPLTGEPVSRAGMTGFEKPGDIGFDLRAAFADFARHITTDADAVAVLPGWTASRGARAEVALAQAIGLPILDALTGQVVEPVLSVNAYQAPAADGRDDADYDASLEESIAHHPAGKQASAGETLTVEETLARHEAARPRLVVAEPPAPAGLPAPSGSAEVRTTSTTGGQKGVKEARYDLIPPGPIKELAVLYGRGAEKYEPNNWKLGYEWSKSYQALLRHLDLWWSREEDIDPEFNTHHLAAVMWHAANLRWLTVNRPQFDDRPDGADGEGEAVFAILPTPQWILDKRSAS